MPGYDNTSNHAPPSAQFGVATLCVQGQKRTSVRHYRMALVNKCSTVIEVHRRAAFLFAKTVCRRRYERLNSLVEQEERLQRAML